MKDKFQFWIKSADKEPGKGTGEYVKSIKKYKELIKLKDWRKMLSNSYIEPFTVDGYKWNSVKHFYHASKFRSIRIPTDYEFYKTFSIESGSPWSLDPKNAEKAGNAGEIGDNGIIPDIFIEGMRIPKNVRIRSDFYKNNIDRKSLTIALFAKFTQNEELKNILLSTKDAELWEYKGRGNPPELLVELMNVRNCIRLYDNTDNLKSISKFNNTQVNKLLMKKLAKKEQLYAQDKAFLNGKKITIYSKIYYPNNKIYYDVIFDDTKKTEDFVSSDKIELI